MENPIQARTDALPPAMLKAMALELVAVDGPEADLVMAATLASLETKINEADFLAFCAALEAAI